MAKTETNQYLGAATRAKVFKRRLATVVPVLALLVIIVVFWWLKLIGITLAGEAFCGFDEHTHVENCKKQSLICEQEHTHTSECYEITYICGLQEHIHKAECYSDITADVETYEDWEATLPALPDNMSRADKIIAIAESQLGYTESELNFAIDADGNRSGYTRYGEWFGNPYGDWSVMFTSFCLRYSGIDELPISSGAEALRLKWEEYEIYQSASRYSPLAGDVVFLDKNRNGVSDATAIITETSESGIKVIEGDNENAVNTAEYEFASAEIIGYGLPSIGNNVVLLSEIETAAAEYTVWLDGTNGGLMGLGGSLDKSYTLYDGEVIKLPEEWQSPKKYNYKLRGWYDVKNAKYYPSGSEITVTENLVFYADWMAADYDVGQFNSLVSDTVSTNSFITTHVFDYNALFNAMSLKPTVTISSTSHSETWRQVTSGKVPYKNAETLDFVFVDYDSGGDISYSSGRGSNNTNGDIVSGLYSDSLADILFGIGNSFDPTTGNGIIGKNHLGTADHLFSIVDDPTSENFGYHYYDSKLHAASYNQSDKRFYVYDYLERTADSEKDGGGGEYSDFLPFNSPYANTNGNTVNNFSYNGLNGEYNGVTHYQYDAKYNTNNNSTSNVGTNYWFGMSIDIEFYLPNTPGYIDPNGDTGNRDIYGQEMHFKFSGDDDVWVLIDGELVLDIGGVHGIESGDINFSTGVISINGENVDTLGDITKGHHVLTVYYLERGSSQSNCAIYFNLAPRFLFTIQKEDILDRHLLDGAEFSVYTDKECTVPAELWVSKDAYDAQVEATNTFTVTNGYVNIWGFTASQTYYIKETKPPNGGNYVCANGIICLNLDKSGHASYDVVIIPEVDENGNEIAISNGYTVYGLRIDEETHEAFLVITNAPVPIPEVTTVQVSKEWNDDLDHTSDSVTVYLTITDPDGTVRRLREITLNEANNWKHTWENLPKHFYNTETEIKYGVEEAYKEGYNGIVESIDKYEKLTVTWTTVSEFESGKSYVLKTANGCLSTTSTSDADLRWVDEATAKESSLALWTATVSDGKVKLVNGAGQILSFNNGTLSSNRYFYATKSSTSYQNLTIANYGSSIRLYYPRSSRYTYYIGALSSNGRATATTSSSSALLFTPMTQTTTKEEIEITGFGYKITNTPLETETSLTVNKVWNTGSSDDKSLYEQLQITVKLLANGKDMGRTVTLNLKNNWTESFKGLPYTDSDGNVIQYTVSEVINSDKWSVSYGETIVKEGNPPTYQITITNTYRDGGPELPSTGGHGKIVWVLSGAAIMLIAVMAGCVLRFRRARKHSVKQ